MTQFQVAQLNALVLPAVWQRSLVESGVKQTSELLVIDCFCGTETQLLLRPEVSSNVPQALVYRVDGKECVPDIQTIPRGCKVIIPKGKEVVIELSSLTARIPISPINDFLDDQNVMLAFVTHDRVEDISEWLSFHAKTQGATAALLVSRLPSDAEPTKQALAKTDIEGIDRILWLDVPVPIGQPLEGSEAARLNAPDAPGKAMLEPLKPDPWRSALFEVSVFESFRNRFLSKANAILFSTPADVVSPPPKGAGTVFEAASTGSGFLRFPGVRAYPFAMKNIEAPKFAEHNCKAFDGKRSDMIWCLAPKKQPDGAFWRRFRVNAPVDPKSENFTYWRCMALRHPGLKPSELAAKTSLVELTELRDVVIEHFDGKPKPPPKPVQAKPPVLKNARVLAITPMKNEGPFILEWLAYHRAIGVTDFLIYSNDCTDGTDEMLNLFDAKGLIEHRDNPFRETGDGPQRAALFDAYDSEIAKQADWMIAIDADEFINVHTGNGTLEALFEAVPDATMISLTWRLFGNANIAKYEDLPLIEQFNKAAAQMTRKPHQAWGFKTLFRNLGHYKKIGVHRPKGLRPEFIDAIHWVNGSGKKLPNTMLRTGWRSNAATVGYDLVSMNHYAVRSAESFLVKRDRGRAYHVERDLGLNYWFRMNHNATTDTSISTKFERFHAERNRLLADPDIAAMHARVVSAHQARISELMKLDHMKRLYDEVNGRRLRMLSRNLHHFGAQVFLDGPDSIPANFEPDHRQRRRQKST